MLRDQIICQFLLNTNIPQLKSANQWTGWECDQNNTRAIDLCVDGKYWTAVICSGENITQLLFEHKDIVGTLPPEFSLLTDLVWIDFTSNRLTGTIPSSYGQLSNLVELTLSENQLAGPIPSSLGNLSNLLNLELSDNSLIGTLPSSIGQLSKLIYMKISNTLVTGSIPSSYGSLLHLEHLELTHNHLVGSIPHTLTSLHNLELLHLENNHLTSSLPSNVTGWSSLRLLSLESNQLTGSLSLTFLFLKNLKLIRLYENLNVSLLNIEQLCEGMRAIEVIEIRDRSNECHPDQPIQIDPGTNPAWNEPDSSIFPLLLVVSGILFLVGLFALDHHCREKKNYLDTTEEIGSDDKDQNHQRQQQQHSQTQITRNPLVSSNFHPRASSNSYSRTLMYGDDDEEEDYELILQEMNQRRSERTSGIGSLSSLTHLPADTVSEVELGLRMSLEAVVDRAAESDKKSHDGVIQSQVY